MRFIGFSTLNLKIAVNCKIGQRKSSLAWLMNLLKGLIKLLNFYPANGFTQKCPLEFSLVGSG